MSFRPIHVNLNNLSLVVHESSLKSLATAGSSTIDIYSISNFAVDQVLLIGELGNEGSEIILTHTSTAPTGNTVTLASNLVKDHPSDTKVYVILFDKIEYSYASTETGSKTVFTGGLVDINPEVKDTLFVNTEVSSGYTFQRFKNSITGLFSDYGDAQPVSGYSNNTVNSVINQALAKTGKDLSTVLTYEMLIDEINDCLAYIRGKLKTWSNTQEFDYIVDQMNRGEYKFTLPTTLYDKNSNRSILSVRVGQSNDNLIYIDKKEFDTQIQDQLKTTVATQPSVGATSLVLTSSDDFPSSGSINIYTDNTLNTVTFTANDKDTNTLSGIPASGDGSITATHTVGTNVWSGESESTPRYFTVFDGSLYILPLIDSTNAEKNIYMDFYTDIVEVDSDKDEFTLVRFRLIKQWLIWQIRSIAENKGVADQRDPAFQMFEQMLYDAIRRESSGQKRKMKPKLNGIFYNNSSRDNQNNFLTS